MVSKPNYNSGRLLFLAFLSICIAGSAIAQRGVIPTDSSSDTGLGGNNSITGTVFYPSGQKVEKRVRVRLFTMTAGDRTSMTDDSGNFSFRGLKNGNYTISIDNEKDYEPFRQEVSIVTLNGSPPQVYTLSIRLTPKGNIEPKAAAVSLEFADVPVKALEFFKKAVELSKAGDHKGSIEQLKLATSEYPDFMLAFNELGVEYLRLNDLEKANESLKMALKIKPEAFEPLMNRGMVLVFLKRFSEAEPFLRNAVKIKVESAVGHYFLGQALANLGHFEDAEKELVTSVKLGGDEMKEAHRILAIIYNIRGDKVNAVVELETYLRLVPNTPDAEQLRQVIQNLRGSGAATPAPGKKPLP